MSECYQRCRQIARGAASSFPRFFRLLSPKKRRGMYALYAFFRHTDDLGDDDAVPIDQRRSRLDAWEASWKASWERHLHASPTGLAGDETDLWLPAVADTVHQFSIPHRSLLDVIDGCRQDLVQREYADFEQLSGYCHLVASSVGLACMHVWGFNDSNEAIEKARSAGLAFQLTNILRDVREDLERERVYLPQDELSRFGCTHQDLSASDPPEKVEQLLNFQIERASRYFDDARGLVPHLSPEGQRIFRLMHGCYSAILQKIRRQGADVLSDRVRLSHMHLMAIVTKGLVGQVFNLSKF